MSEAGFQIFNEAFAVGAELLYAAYLTLFFRPFMSGSEHRGQKCVIIFFSYLFISYLCNWVVLPQGMFSLVLVVFLVAGSKMTGLERSMSFLLGILFWNSRISSGLTVQSLYFIVDRIIPQPLDPPEAAYFRAASLLMLLILSHAVLFAAMLYAFWNRMRKQRLPLHCLEMCYISLLPAAGILFGQIIIRLLYEIRDGELLQLYERHPSFLVVVPLLALLFFGGAWLTILFQQKMDALREEQAAGYVERQQIELIRAQIHEAEQFYNRIRRLKHEMRGHLNNIKGLVSTGEYVDLEKYISRMDGDMSDVEMSLRTGNPVSDVIVNDKRRQCMDLGIRFQIEFHYPESGNYDAFDVGIILQNLLQNALEACENMAENERFISLTGKQKGHFFLIEIQNSFAGEVAFGQDGLPVTGKKADVSMHGIGLSNVRRIVEKYMGEMEISLENQVFQITVMVQAQWIE